MDDAAREAQIWTHIYELDEEIASYTRAREPVVTAKNSCRNTKDNWQNSYDGLANNPDLAQVKKKDVFEGEMAEKLGTKISEAMTSLSSGLSAAEELTNALDNQVQKIEDKVQELRDERQSWYNML